jgi:hypothetical protein
MQASLKFKIRKLREAFAEGVPLASGLSLLLCRDRYLARFVLASVTDRQTAR